MFVLRGGYHVSGTPAIDPPSPTRIVSGLDSPSFLKSLNGMYIEKPDTRCTAENEVFLDHLPRRNRHHLRHRRPTRRRSRKALQLFDYLPRHKADMS